MCFYFYNSSLFFYEAEINHRKKLYFANSSGFISLGLILEETLRKT